jgi:glycolate oxidase
MELTKEEYSALEDVVGSEYITREPAIRDTYNQIWLNKLLFGEKWSNRPAAVLLPGSTEEVQAILKVCNRYKIPFKPLSSGFEVEATALDTEKAITMDLRRMNRILEIDAKNMHAVVEPYVSMYRLQRETAKYGLRIGSIGVGPSGGVVAAACCHYGEGPTSLSTGGLGRNVLGCEWVLPTGDLLRLGTSESRDGWFSADGPGLSLRGILRGLTGANGSHGVITKASVKLYPWYGPPDWELVGEIPGLKHFEKVLDGYKVFVITFPDNEKAFSALRDVAQADIACSCILMAFGSPAGEGNDEAWENFQKMGNLEELDDLFNRSLAAVLGASSTREMEYREKYLLEISKKWGGEVIPQLNGPDAQASLFGMIMFVFEMVRNELRTTTEFFVMQISSFATIEQVNNLRQAAEEIREPYHKSGAILQREGLYLAPMENQTIGSAGGTGTHHDPFDPDSLKAVREAMAKTLDTEGPFRRCGVPMAGGGQQIESVMQVHQRWGPLYDNYDFWLRKIKAALDPNNVGDPSGYVPPAYPEE